MGGGGYIPPPHFAPIYMHTDVWRLVPLSVFIHLSMDVRWLVPLSIDPGLTALCSVSYQVLCDRVSSPSWVILMVVPPSWRVSFARKGIS